MRLHARTLPLHLAVAAFHTLNPPAAVSRSLSPQAAAALQPLHKAAAATTSYGQQPSTPHIIHQQQRSTICFIHNQCCWHAWGLNAGDALCCRYGCLCAVRSVVTCSSNSSSQPSPQKHQTPFLFEGFSSLHKHAHVLSHAHNDILQHVSFLVNTK